MPTNLQDLQPFIVDNTSHLRAPIVGDRYTSWLDTVEIIEVSEPMTLDGKTDIAVRFKVIELHADPSEGSEVGLVTEMLFGDLIDNDDYTLATYGESPMSISDDLFDQYIAALKEQAERESKEDAFDYLERLCTMIRRPNS